MLWGDWLVTGGGFRDPCRLFYPQFSPVSSPRPLIPPYPSPRCVNVSPQDDGYTPLHWASWNGNVTVVQYLVETAKADVEAKQVRWELQEEDSWARGLPLPSPSPPPLFPLATLSSLRCVVC